MKILDLTTLPDLTLPVTHQTSDRRLVNTSHIIWACNLEKSKGSYLHLTDGRSLRVAETLDEIKGSL